MRRQALVKKRGQQLVGGTGKILLHKKQNKTKQNKKPKKKTLKKNKQTNLAIADYEVIYSVVLLCLDKFKRIILLILQHKLLI